MSTFEEGRINQQVNRIERVFESIEKNHPGARRRFQADIQQISERLKEYQLQELIMKGVPDE